MFSALHSPQVSKRDLFIDEHFHISVAVHHTPTILSPVGEDTEPYFDDKEVTAEKPNTGLLLKLRNLWRFAIPNILSHFLSEAGSFAILYFASRYGTDVLAAFSLSDTFANITSASIFSGLSTYVETYVSQHNGAGQYDAVASILWRSFTIMSILIIPIAVLWLYAGQVFFSFGMDSATCDIISSLMKWRIMILPAELFNTAFSEYVFAVGVVKPYFWAQLVNNASVVVLCILFSYLFDVGYHSLVWSRLSLHTSTLSHYLS
jgi:Na+-driven multidrug efflux pump